MTITPQTVRTVIEKRFKLVQLPLANELRDFNLTDADLLQLRVSLSNEFRKDVTLNHSDTVYTITDKLLAA